MRISPPIAHLRVKYHAGKLRGSPFTRDIQRGCMHERSRAGIIVNDPTTGERPEDSKRKQKDNPPHNQ